MPEREIRLFSGTNPVYVGHLNPDDELVTDTDDDGNYIVTIKGAIPQGDVHEVSVGPGAAGGVVKVWPPMTETQAVQDADKKVAAADRKGASAQERKAAKAEGLPEPADTTASPATRRKGEPAPSRTKGETPPESGGKAGTGFSGQVAP